MAQYLVGLDGGTTGCKTCIFDLDGKLVGSDYREYPSYYPEPGWVEQTTEDLLPNFYDSIKTAINKSGINYESLSKDLKLLTHVLFPCLTKQHLSHIISFNSDFMSFCKPIYLNMKFNEKFSEEKTFEPKKMKI